jgi:hypothetical protein
MSNLIVEENKIPGVPSTQWDLNGPGSSNIVGFATDISVNLGGTVNFKIDTDSTNYRIDIYRLGYYQGNGARLITTIQQLNKATNQAGPIVDRSIGLVDAGNWVVSASWTVPANLVSGVYLAHLVRQDATSGANHIPFIVRDDQKYHDIVFQTSDTTWHAYNGWGGYSLYGGGATASNDGRAFKVSYNRPIATRDGVGTYAGPQDFLFGEEIAAIHWLEANGYDVCYMAGVDTDRLDPSGKGGQFKDAFGNLNRKVFLSVGHDEYWSGPSNKNQPNTGQRANVEAALAAGVNLAFWSGNEVFWKTRYESSTVTTDGSPTAYRTLVCYKETRQDRILDPFDPPICTCTWRDPRFRAAVSGDPTDAGTISPQGDAGKPENALTGTIFQVDDFREDQILIPYPMTQLRFWRNTPTVAATAPGNSGSLVKNYLGYEWDESPSTGYYGKFRPAGQIHLSLTTVSVNSYLLDYGHTEGPGIATHSLSLYRHPSGALVFGAGTVMWSWGLDADHDPDPKDTKPTPTDPNVKQAMVNLLSDYMGLSAGSPQPGLVFNFPPLDTTAPISTITSPTNGASVTQNQTVTITGTSQDPTVNGVAGVVAGVEVSTDGTTWQPATITSWNPASHTAGWSYNWTPVVAGNTPVTIGARAVDDSLNLEAGGPSVQVTVAAATGVSLFSGSDTPAVVAVNDPHSVELGLKFQSSQPGTITGIRFYKGPNNAGTHVGNLWSSLGTLLMPSVTFTNETSGGWQQVNLSSPVSITANTVYVVSYHTNGNYSASNHYFDTAAHTNGPLTAPATGTVGGNGVYTYGTGSTFPTKSFLGTNYWVDVVFNPSGGGTPGQIAIDATISQDQSTAPITTPAFSTTSGNELLLAFVATDYLSGANTTVTGVSGGGLTWALVSRTNVQRGTSEIWRAFAPAPLSNVTVTATLSQNVAASLTVMSFTGVDTTGTNGSGAIGATGSGNSGSGAPTASLVTTRNGSWVLGVGNDYDKAISRTPGMGQVLVHQYLAPAGDTYWVQRNTTTAASGTTVSINDTAPTTDRYNLTICEVLPATG